MDLKKFIKENRIAQVELAELFECGQSNVSSIVNGKRNLTKLQIRLLIEKYGVDKVMPYADPNEIPQGNIVNISAPVITDNSAPVQAGNNNSMEVPPDAGIVEVLRQQSNQITTLLSQQQTMLAHQERLIALLENKGSI